MSSNISGFIIIFVVLSVMGVTLLLRASKDIPQQNVNSKPEPLNFVKKFRISVRTIVGLWFIISALVGLYMTITRLY